jgi:hypothetical protein
MRMPGFSAEASLKRSEKTFELFVRVPQDGEGEIIPQAGSKKFIIHATKWCKKWGGMYHIEPDNTGDCINVMTPEGERCIEGFRIVRDEICMEYNTGEPPIPIYGWRDAY